MSLCEADRNTLFLSYLDVQLDEGYFSSLVLFELSDLIWVVFVASVSLTMQQYQYWVCIYYFSHRIAGFGGNLF